MFVVSPLPLRPAAAAGHASAIPAAVQRTLAPQDPGAPFLPSAGRDDVILARLHILVELDDLRDADISLRTRQALEVTSPAIGTVDDDRSASGVGETIRILESQIAAYERELASIEENVDHLLAETSEFGIGAAAFPLASVRKPFFNDWGRARSGGRRHQGTDVLAQTGVELRAIEDGTVEQIKNGSLGGLSVYLLGDSGSRYYYAHLDEAEVLADGERVYAGQRIGTVGDSGNAKGSHHLHIQWSPTGGSNWQNPFPLLDTLFKEGAEAETVVNADDATPALSALGSLNDGP